VDTHVEPPRSRLSVLRERGLLGTAAWFFDNAYYYLWLRLTPSGRKELRFDQLDGALTTGVVVKNDLGVSEPELNFAIEYAPSRIRHVWRILSGLPKNATFIDIGYGKGRVLIVAADLGFDKLIGIDLWPALIDVARPNVESGTKAACQPLCCDAL